MHKFKVVGLMLCIAFNLDLAVETIESRNVTKMSQWDAYCHPTHWLLEPPFAAGFCVTEKRGFSINPTYNITSQMSFLYQANTIKHKDRKRFINWQWFEPISFEFLVEISTLLRYWWKYLKIRGCLDFANLPLNLGAHIWSTKVRRNKRYIKERKYHSTY